MPSPDTSVKGAGYGEEKKMEDFKAATKPAQIPVEFPPDIAPDDAEPEEEPTPAELGGDDLEIPGLGNLGEILFAGTERPEESVNTPPESRMFSAADLGPKGPPQEYQVLVRDPRVDPSTRALVSFVSRMMMLRQE